MNLINLLPSTAAADYASLTDADRADLHNWFDTVNAINDEVEAAWDRFARDVDAGGLWAPLFFLTFLFTCTKFFLLLSP